MGETGRNPIVPIAGCFSQPHSVYRAAHHPVNRPRVTKRRRTEAFGTGVRMTVMEDVRGRLEAERQQTLRRLANLTHDFDTVVSGSRDISVDDEHDPEGATIAFERSQVAAFIRQTEHHLEEIHAALQRLDAGGYGTCEGCGGVIDPARLAARPVSRTCIRCAASS